jgi:hypothetical protein
MSGWTSAWPNDRRLCAAASRVQTPSARHRAPAKDKWLLHAGDAYFFHGQIAARPRMPLVLGLFQRRADMDRATRLANQEGLRVLKQRHDKDVTIFNSHDPLHYEACRCGGLHS